MSISIMYKDNGKTLCKMTVDKFFKVWYNVITVKGEQTRPQEWCSANRDTENI